MHFEWDAAKARINKAKHGVDFGLAPEFDFANAVIATDDSEIYGEERLIATGIIGLSIYVMVYVERDETIRVISLRRRKKSRTMSKASSRPRTTIVRREATPPTRTPEEARAIARAALALMSDEEDAAITAAALADPDAQPLDMLELRRRPGRPRAAVKKIAASLKLDPDVVSAYRAKGPGWQTRMNDDLRKAAKLKRSAG